MAVFDIAYRFSCTGKSAYNHGFDGVQANADVARRVPTAAEGLDKHHRTVRRSSTYTLPGEQKTELCSSITPIIERMLQASPLSTTCRLH